MELVQSRRLLFKKVIVSLFLFCFSVFVSCALFSFHPEDPSWFFARSGKQTIANILGVAGANCAALLFFLFGSASLLLIPYLFFFTHVIALGELKDEWDRLIMFLCSIVLCTVLGSLYHCAIIMHGFLPGGCCGWLLHTHVLRLMDPTLAIVFVHCLFLVSVVVASRLSVICIVHYGKYAIAFVLQKFVGWRSCALYCVRCIGLLFLPFKRAAVWVHQLLSSYYVEQRPGLVVDFDDAVHRQMNKMLEDPVWRNYSVSESPEPSFARKEINPVEDTFADDCVEQALPSGSEKIFYQLPPLKFFKSDAGHFQDPQLRQEHEAMAMVLEEKLARFGIQGKVIAIKAGPVITLFEYQPHIDSKISKIIALEDDLALALQAMSIRIIAPIPGTAVVGFEVANTVRSNVLFSRIVHSQEFAQYAGALPLVLGVDTVGTTMIVDLTAMPHVLIAGSTGSGKSVAMNVILISLLYRCNPDELQLILIDPKRLEFAPYADIAHLIFPIITHPKNAAPALQWVVNTMEVRYELMAQHGVRTMVDYNTMADHNGYEKLPFIVVMIDELSDLMMVAGKDIEEKIARIAQMARAAGIHLIVATQRPSVDVITGIIKANFPSRISFKVATKIDSRTILDAVGADKLLGKGDMLYLDTGSRLVRAHGAFVSDQEIQQVCNYIRAMRPPCYRDFLQEVSKETTDVQSGDEQLYGDVVAYLETIDEVSISALQRKFRIGYNRSARIIELLESHGVVARSDGGKMRKIIR